MIIFTYVSIPAASTAVGGLVGAFKPPGPKVRSAIQHFAAGVVFSVVAVELLPHIVREHKPSPVLIGFPLGVIAMLGLRALTRDVEHSAKSEESLRPVQKWPIALIAAIAIDILIDGMILGVGFSAGDREGRLLTLALTVELLSLGLAGFSHLGERWNSARQSSYVDHRTRPDNCAWRNTGRNSAYRGL